MQHIKDQIKNCNQKIEKYVPFEKAWASSVALLIPRGDEVVVHGSGTLFAIADDYFVVTAAHVFDNAKELGLLMSLNDEPELLPLNGALTHSTSEQVDIAAICLEPEISAKIDQSRFLRFDDVCLSEEGEDAAFALFGFPTKLSVCVEDILKLKKFFYVTRLHKGCTNALENFDERLHFALLADLEETKTVDGDSMEFLDSSGKHLPFPADLRGISGCGVWRVARNAQEIVKGTAKAKLVGVQNSVYSRSKIIKSIWWASVAEMLWQTRPDLRSALAMCRIVDD